MVSRYSGLGATLREMPDRAQAGLSFQTPEPRLPLGQPLVRRDPPPCIPVSMVRA